MTDLPESPAPVTSSVGKADPHPALAGYARRVAVVCAFAGVALACVLFAALAGFETVALSIWLGTYAGRLVLGLLVLFTTAGLAAPRALVPTTVAGRWAFGLRGALFGLFCLVLAIGVPATASLIVEPFAFAFGVGVAVFDWVGKPVYWVLLFGGLPAAGLGVTAAQLIRRRFTSTSAGRRSTCGPS